MVEPISDFALEVIEAKSNMLPSDLAVAPLRNSELRAIIARLRQAEAALVTARNDALEEAAALARTNPGNAPCIWQDGAWVSPAALDTAAAILALKSP